MSRWSALLADPGEAFAENEELIDDTEKKERIVAAAKQKGNGQTEEIQRMLDLMK